MSISTTPSPHPLKNLSENQIDLLKKTICKGATNEELEMFLYICDKMKLDPFLKQVYAVKRKEKKPDGTYGDVMTMQTGIDGYRLLAERTGKYMAGRESTFQYDTNGYLLSATAYVKKLGPDNQWHEVSATAYWKEYVQTDKEGKPTKFWEKMPHGQLSKCSETLALRKAFPADLSGIRTREEMAQADSEDILTLPAVAQKMQEQKVVPIEAKTEHSLVEIEKEQQIVMISEVDSLNIEALINPDDKEGPDSYRTNLLKFFAVKYKLPVCNAFTDVPEKALKGIFKSVHSRNEFLMKHQSEQVNG